MSDKRETLINISNGLIQTGALYELCETDSMRRVMLYLVSISINGKLKYDPFEIYNDYYKKGKIAACVRYETIMTRCHLKDRKTFMGTLKSLESRGFIIRKKARIKGKAGYPQNVYILGTCKEYGWGTWKQLFLMDKFYEMYPEKNPGNE